MEDFEITVTRSAGDDGAILVLVSGHVDRVDGGPGLRVRVNDAVVYAAPDFTSTPFGAGREAGQVTVSATDIAYTKEAR